MKYAAIFAFVAFAFLAQANARSVFVNGSIDRGAIADALRAKLTVSKEKLNKFLNSASTTLKIKIAEAQKKAEELIEKLKQKATEIREGVYAASEKLISKIEKIEDKYLALFQNKDKKVVEDKPQPTEETVDEESVNEEAVDEESVSEEAVAENVTESQ